MRKYARTRVAMVVVVLLFSLEVGLVPSAGAGGSNAATAVSQDAACQQGWETVDVGPLGNVRNSLRQKLVDSTGYPKTCLNVRFEAGQVYNFENCANDETGIGPKSCIELVDGHKDIVFDGQGARFVLHERTAGFADINGASNIIFQNFSLEHQNVPFVQGELFMAAGPDDQEWIDIKITDSRSADFDDLKSGRSGAELSDFLFSGARTWGNVFPETTDDTEGSTADGLRHAYRMTGMTATNVTEIYNESGEIWRIHPDWLITPTRNDFDLVRALAEEEDTYYWVGVAKHGAACFDVTNTPDGTTTTFKNLKMHTCNVQAFGFSHNDGDLAILNSVIEPLDGMQISINGGVVLNIEHRGKLTVRGNDFHGVADDGINTNTREKQVDAIDCASTGAISTLTYTGRDQDPVKEGDVLQLTAPLLDSGPDNVVDRFRGAFLAGGSVTSVQGSTLEMTDEFWSDICKLDGLGNGVFAFEGRFDRGMSLFNESASAPGSVIRDNKFSVRGSGVHYIGVDTNIVGNTFESGLHGVDVGAIHDIANQATGGSDYGQGPYPRGLLIKDNDFLDRFTHHPIRLVLPGCLPADETIDHCLPDIGADIRGNLFFNPDNNVGHVEIYGGYVTAINNAFRSGPQTDPPIGPPITLRNSHLTTISSGEEPCPNPRQEDSPTGCNFLRLPGPEACLKDLSTLRPSTHAGNTMTACTN